jgi:uncharacterized surface protein with fasciclin (FAS1) repeats
MAAALAAVLTAPAAVVAQDRVSSEEVPMKDIVAVAVEAGSFKTLVAAVQAAGLVEALRGPGPFTVFAPSDAAFAKLPPGTLESLLKDPERLKQILTYHVLAGRVTAEDIQAEGRADPVTLNGQSLRIRVQGGQVLVNGATVTAADVPASNGVIHVIDAVLLPARAPAPAGR